jgi:beta-glucosidase-like glycosyl hydrolase
MCTYANHFDPETNFSAWGCQNHRALTTVLRETWSSKQEGVPGIRKGFVVADCAGAVHDVPTAMNAGTDVSCQGGFEQAGKLVTEGRLNESTLNQAVSRALYGKE